MMATGRFEHLITRAADHTKKPLLNQLTLFLAKQIMPPTGGQAGSARPARHSSSDGAGEATARWWNGGRDVSTAAGNLLVGSASQPARRWWGRTRCAASGVPVFLSLTL